MKYCDNCNEWVEPDDGKCPNCNSSLKSKDGEKEIPLVDDDIEDPEDLDWF